MSHLQIPTKGPRKRASTEAVRESGQHRKKVENAPKEKEIADVRNEIEAAEASETEIDMSDMKVVIEGMKEARRKDEKKGKR
jgi:hypothetical protein